MKTRIIAQSAMLNTGSLKDGPTGCADIIDGDEFFEVMIDGSSVWLPAEPDVVYGRTGEWKGWCDFLGSDDFEQVTKEMTEEDKAKEWHYYCQNKEGKD